MSINEINAEAKESLRKYFKNGQDVKHENEARKELTKEEIFESVAGEIKESEMKLEQRNQMRNTLQQDAKEAFEEELEEYLWDQDELDETPDWLPDAPGHKIGGYPCFTQEDPRNIPKEDHHDILLLQIDTDNIGEREIMWGDSGVANFFISRENLKQRNFQDVIYTWDCC